MTPPLWQNDFPGGSDGKSVCLQCRSPGLDPRVGKIPWRRKWQPTPVLLPGKSHGQRSLVGYYPWMGSQRVRHDWVTSFPSFLPSLWQKAKRNWRASFWKWKSEKAGLKLNIKKMKMMASDPVTSWQIDRQTMETVTDFIFLGSKNHCRWWLQPWNYKDACSLEEKLWPTLPAY